MKDRLDDLAGSEADVQAGVGVAIDALYGAVDYRLLVSHAPLGAAYADTLIGQVFPAFERKPE